LKSGSQQVAGSTFIREGDVESDRRVSPRQDMSLVATRYRFLACKCLDSEDQTVQIPEGAWSVSFSGPLSLVNVNGGIVRLHRITLQQLQREGKVAPEPC
jgi:hypothetical protein